MIGDIIGALLCFAAFYAICQSHFQNAKNKRTDKAITLLTIEFRAESDIQRRAERTPASHHSPYVN